MRKLLNREGKKPSMHPRFSVFLFHSIQQPKCQCPALKNQRIRKNKEEAAEYAKFLAKRMKEAKKLPGVDCQEEEAVLSDSVYLSPVKNEIF